MAKIIKLVSENVKRLVAVEIDPAGNVIVVGGRNAQGKSSVLDSIEMALRGKSAICDEPVHRGAEKGQIVCHLDNGLVVKKIITKAGGATLTVTNADGSAKYSSPQTMLDALVGKLTFDPLDFMRMRPKERLDTLKELVGLDFSQIDATRKSLYDDRTLAGRDVSGREGQIERMPQYDGVPAKEVSINHLVEQLNAANVENQKCERAAAELGRARQNKGLCASAVEQAQRALAAAEKALADASKELAMREAAYDAMSIIDISPIQAQIDSADEINRKVRANSNRQELRRSFASKKREYDRLTQEIGEIDQKKAQMLAGAKFPVQGLSFSDSGVLYNDLPFEQASQAEKLRVSIAMGLALNPELRVILVRDASLLDDENMEIIAEMAKEFDAQVWLERVGEGKECSVVIEDGHVKERD